MSRVRIFVFGDSHTHALSLAARQAADLPDDVEFDIHWSLKEKNGNVRGDMKKADALEAVAALQGRDIAVVALLGTLHNVFGLLRHERPFQLMDATSEAFDASHGELLPRAAMYDALRHRCEENGFLAAVRKRTRVRVFHLMTPPPKTDSEFLLSKIDRYRGRRASDVGVADAASRLRFWQLEKQVVSDFCEALGVTLVAPPIQALDASGFLRKAFYADDATHANAAYGALVLEQLRQLALGDS